jgi:adenine-specific DNA-methyltransferase
MNTLLSRLSSLNEEELRRELTELLTRQKLGLNWEHSAIERDRAVNAEVVLPRLVPEDSHNLGTEPCSNLIIEGDNFDSLRLLRATHANKIRMIYIDPPYNTGNKDWVYNDSYVGENDRWRHSQWLEFLYQRLVLAKDLLTPDGAIMVSIDDDNRSKLELLLDQVFPGARLGSFVWKVRSGGNDTKGALLSNNHEHVLVYGSPSFLFRGDSRDENAFDNPDNDPRGSWSNDNLVQAKTAKQRPEAYYHLQSPKSGIWYLADIDSAWRFSSTSRPLKKILQSVPMEVLIAEERVLWPKNEKTVTYGSVQEIKSAIKAGTAPKQLKIYTQINELEKAAETDVKVARLLTYIDPIETWVGRTIGYGKPRYKRFRTQLKRDVTPLSSWLTPAADGQDDDDESVTSLTVGATGEGTALYKRIFDNKDFPYPKPLSLILGLLDQATRPGDIILDFFAGSGTTGHAVLELNQRDNGQRSFILCSSTETSRDDPGRNICRDVCAERMRRVMAGYGNTPGLGGSFAYLRLDKFDPADAELDAEPQHIRQLLSLRFQGAAIAQGAQAQVDVLASSDDVTAVYLREVTAQSIAQLAALPTSRLIVFSNRPQTVLEMLPGKDIDSRSIAGEICAGQAGAPSNSFVQSASKAVAE